VKIEGLDELQRKLTSLSDKAKELDGTHSVSMSDLLTPDFVSRHTRFENVENFLQAGGFSCGSQAEFEAIPEDKLDAFIRSVSSFASWQEMLGAAGQEWAASKLGL